MLQLAPGHPFRVHVRDLFQLQRPLQRHRVTQPASGVEEVAVLAVAVSERLDLLFAVQDPADLIRHRPQRSDQLLPALQRDPAVHGGEAQREQVEAHQVRQEGFRRRHPDLGAGVQVDRAVGVSRGAAGEHVGHRHRQRPALLGLMQPDHRVRGLTGLRDDHRQCVRPERRPPVAKLCRINSTRRQTCPVLDRVLADERRVPGGSHPKQQDLAVAPQLLIGQGELSKRDRAVIGQPPAHRVRDRLRRLVDLLEHEVRVAALLGLAHVPVDMDELGLDSRAVQRRHLGTKRRHRGHLSLTEHEHAFGVRDDGRDVGRDVELLLAQPHHQGCIEPCADQELGILGREHRQRVGAADPLERCADRGQEVALVVRLDEVRHDLGVGLGRELVPGLLQLLAQLGEVLDDPVVDHEDAAVAVRVRMRVDVGRPAMCRPAGMPDAEVSGRLDRLDLGDQVVDLRLRLGDAGADGRSRLRGLQHGHPGRVIAAVLEALEALQEHRGGFALAQVSDDPAHL